ncbi:glycosyltransferase family 4 protein [Cetobacterium sp.]|uniref:glycosyltransferase family 4 protein n=1 Tax=Cetobacterium sp. TaxID=2071632 RepID=UPI003F2B5881
MKKIGFVESVGYGLYNFRGGIIKDFCKKGYEVYIICPHFPEIKEMEKWGCKHIPISINRLGKNPIYELITLYKLIKTYKKLKLDLAFNFSIKPNIYGGIASQITNTKYVGIIPGAGRVFSKKNIKRKLGAFLYTIGLKNAEKVLFLNDEDLEEFLDLKIILSKNKSINMRSEGVNLKKFSNSKKIEFNRELNFIMISRITKEKGVFEYLEAAKYLKEKYQDKINFIYLGGFGEISQEVFLSKAKESQVQYLGVSSKVKEILEKCHCFILPSFYREGVPRTLLEAGALGLPLITTDNIGCKDTVDHEISGYISKKEDISDLIKNIENFINLSEEKKQEMSFNIKNKIKKEFCEKRIIEIYNSILKEIK